MAIVKLMGRECGFVSMFATLATNDVDVCLIPERLADRVTVTGFVSMFATLATNGVDFCLIPEVA
ncbi:hypothetical protein T484DRAFT_1806590 [Baffinella frigidus]|nr:hypothetical protein T484DRAFT_1806590 [Cryptophyta sp. CCMP2293]